MQHDEPHEIEVTMRKDVCSLGESQAVLEWPPTVTPQHAEDLVNWLELMLRKVSRTVRPDAPASTEKEYGEITYTVRTIVARIDGEFTPRDIVMQSDRRLNSTTVSGVLRKMESEQLIRCVKRGSGKRPSTFLRIAG